MKLSVSIKAIKKVVLAVFLILIGCKDSTIKELKNKSSNDIGIKKVNGLSCEDVVYKIVKSSNLALRGEKDFLTQIDRIEGDNIIIQVYLENNISDDPTKKQIVESTIAWLTLDLNANKLFNTTADPDNPIELNFDKKLVSQNDVFSLCQIVKKEKKNSVADQNIKYSILPVDFDEYYKACVNPYDSIKCNKNYPKYFFKEEDAIAKIFGNKFHPSDYMYLPKLRDCQPIVLFNTDSDIESYDLVVLKNNKIISSIEIGIMDGESIVQFNISRDYIISLYKKKNANEKKVFLKSYIITDNGIIKEEKTKSKNKVL